MQERFLPVGLHKHKYIEFLYVYSGTCENTINGKMISLNAGDICIMNVNTCHSLTCKSENDIAINCLMAREYFDSVLTASLSSDALFSAFSPDNIFNQDHKQYALFIQQDVSAIYDLFCEVLTEFQQRNELYQVIIKSFLTIIFARLVRSTNQSLVGISSRHKPEIWELMQYIRENCTRITLSEMAAHFSYESTYLSKTIKKNPASLFWRPEIKHALT